MKDVTDHSAWRLAVVMVNEDDDREERGMLRWMIMGLLSFASTIIITTRLVTMQLHGISIMLLSFEGQHG